MGRTISLLAIIGAALGGVVIVGAAVAIIVVVLRRPRPPSREDNRIKPRKVEP